jgi:proton-translocating NADH-quinone oxidoreductase chain N
MWLTDMMEYQFAGAMLCLLVDFGRRYYGRARQYVVATVGTASLLASLAALIVTLRRSGNQTTQISPVTSPLANLYLVDRFGLLVIFTILVVGVAVTVYSSFYFGKDDNAGPFFSLLLILITSCIGVVSAGDFMTLFLFWEGMSISAYGLVAFRRRQLSLEATLKYLFLAGVGTLLFLFGVAVFYSLVGSIQYSAVPAILSQDAQLGLFSMLMMIVGLGIEAAIFPVYTWLPDAYGVAPVPVSAFLSGVVTETAVFGILKLAEPIAFSNTTGSSILAGVQMTLVVLAVLTMFAGNLGALAQTNLRRMLAFSSIAQVGYMVAAISTFTVNGLIAVVFHIWNQGLVKSNFFMLTGADRSEYEENELEEMKGLGQQERTLGVLYASSSLAMVGSPPFGMFWSEILILQSVLYVGSATFYALAGFLLLNILLSIIYYFRILNTTALSQGPGRKAKMGTALILIPFVLLLLSLVTGILPSIILRIIT